MKFPFKKFVATLSMVAPVIAMVVPGGDVIAPYLPSILKGIADAERTPGTAGQTKRGYVVEIAVNAAHITNAAKPGTVNPVLVGEVAGAYVDAVVGTINLARDAQAALPTVSAPLLIAATS